MILLLPPLLLSFRRYLMAFDGEKNIVAMSHFRFDLDEDVEVIYW